VVALIRSAPWLQRATLSSSAIAAISATGQHEVTKADLVRRGGQ
jgi:hypothetical protein